MIKKESAFSRTAANGSNPDMQRRMTCPNVLAWDIETAPDLRVFCCCYGLEGKSDDEIRDAMSDRFPKHIYACRMHFQRPISAPKQPQAGRVKCRPK